MSVSYDTLLRQAWMTAHDYMQAAIRYIDEMLGDGYAAKHPELIAAFMEVCVRDFQSGVLVKLVEDHVDSVVRALENRDG